MLNHVPLLWVKRTFASKLNSLIWLGPELTITTSTAFKNFAKTKGHGLQFKPEYVDKARELAEHGATLHDLGAYFRVTTRTITNWINQFPEFGKAIQAGNDVFNPRVERAMAETAIGHWVSWEEEVKHHGKVVGTVTKQQYIPPNPTMQIFWSKHRMKDRWADVHKIEQTQTKTRDQILDEIVEYMMRLREEGYDLTLPPLPAPKDGSDA